MVEYVLPYMKFNRVITSVVLVSSIIIAAFLLYRNPFHEPPPNRLHNFDGHIFPTVVLQKPRDKIIIYKVQAGDTISSIGVRFDISADTIKWANELKSETLTVGQSLKILPVTGIAHVVVKGDTVESLALKYHTTEQKIIDFPYNEYADSNTYSLILGETLILPDGKI